MIFKISSPISIPAALAGDLSIKSSTLVVTTPLKKPTIVKTTTAIIKFATGPARMVRNLLKAGALSKLLGSFDSSSSPSIAQYPPIGIALKE